MAKKGEVLGKMGDSTYYRTPDGKVVDDQGNEVKGGIAKTLAAEYEAKQQEKAKAQAEAKAAAEEDKRQKAAEKSAEIARKASERQDQQQRAAAERQAAAEAKRQQVQADRETAKQSNTRAPASPPRQQAPRQQQAAPPPTAPPTAGDQIKGAFKSAAMNVGRTAFDAAFPTISKAINTPKSAAEAPGGDSINGGGARQAINRVADEVNTTNMMLQTSIARQEMTNQILTSILNEVQQIKKPSLGGSILDAAGDLLGMGGKGKAAAGAAGAVTPKSGILGKTGSVLRRAPLIGSLLGGGLAGYDEYQESGNATRAASTGVGAAAGGGLGAWGGATTGAALGAFGGPVGMAIGGLLGAAVGGIGGSYLGGKAGKAGYDALATPSVPAPSAMGPQASQDVKAAQAAKPQPQEIETPRDSIVNAKTLTFNADSIIFNAKNQQATAATAAAPPATNAGPSNAASRPAMSAGGKLLPLPTAQSISGPTQSGSVKEALASAQTPSFFGFGTSQINDARAGAATSSFGVTPGAAAPARVQPGQGAMAGGAQTASLSAPGSGGGVSDASAVQLASTMVGKNRIESLDYLKAGGFNNKGEAWCAEFVNSTLKQTGGTGTGDKIANSFQKWGTSIDPTKVQAGDVVLQTKGNGPGQVGGHVGIATGVYQHGQIEMIAGNSGKVGSVRKYFVPVNGQLQVRRGAGGSGNNPKVAEATKDPSAGNAAGASTAGSSNGSTKANLTPKESAALGAASSTTSDASKVADPTSRRFDAEGNKLEASPGGGIKRFDPTTGKFEEPPKPDNSDPYLRKIKPKGEAEGLTDAAIKRAKETAAQAAEITGPKTFNVGTGRWEAYELAKQPSYEPAKIYEPKPITKGAELNRASTKDMIDDRSAKKGITVNQNTSATPKSDDSKGRFSSGDVGNVEPVDARLRLKELFGIMSA